MRTGRVQPLPPISTCFGANREGMTILQHDANEEGPVLLVLPFNTTQTGRGQSPSSLFQHNANSEGMTVTPLVILPFVATPTGGVTPLLVLIFPFDMTQMGRGQSLSSLVQHNPNGEHNPLLPFLSTQHQWGGVNPHSTREGPPTGYSEASLVLFLFY